LSSFRNRFHLAPLAGPVWWVAAAWLAIALVAQVTVAHFTRIRDVEPSFVLVAVVWYATRADARRSTAYGLAAGLCEDILATGTGGAWTISTTIAALTASALSRGFFADSLGVVAAIAAIATLVRDLIFWILRGFEGFPPGLAVLHFHQTLLQSLLNAVTMVIVMLLQRQWEARFL
jgi:rod shape-determining protein MreD